jgi:hypothetical protein
MSLQMTLAAVNHEIANSQVFHADGTEDIPQRCHRNV